MKVVNYYQVPNNTKAKELYEFVKKYYEYIDVIEISMSTLLDDIKTRPYLYDSPFVTDPISIFRRTFSNEFWKLHREVTTPEVVTEIYMHAVEFGDDEFIAQSFLDICYHYGIVIFLKDFYDEKLLKKLKIDFIQWLDLDTDMKSYIRKMYYVVDNKYGTEKSEKELEKKKLLDYKNAMKRFPDINVYTASSLNYLYGEVVP